MIERTEQNYIRTYTNKKFWPLNPIVEDICIEDIAHALALQNRWTGHSKVPYSIAAHSLAVAYFVPKELQLAALLHDASEAYLSDIARPIKSLIPKYKKFENLLQTSINLKFGIYSKSEDYFTIKQWDDIALYNERYWLFTDDKTLAEDVQKFDKIKGYNSSMLKLVDFYSKLKWEWIETKFLNEFDKLYAIQQN